MSEGRSSERHGEEAQVRLQVYFKAALRGHTKEVESVRFSPDGDLLASVASDGIHLWNIAEQKTLCLIEEAILSHIDFSADGRLLAGVTRDGMLRLWTINGDIVAELGHDGSGITEAVFSTDGHFLISGDISGRVQMWNVATKQVIYSFQGVPPDEVAFPQKSIQGISDFALTRDGKRLAILPRNIHRPVYVWNIEESGKRAEWIGSIMESRLGKWTLAFSPDGRFLAVSDIDSTSVWLFDARSLTLVGMLSLPVEDAAKSIAFSPDGRFLAVAGGVRGVVWIWNIDNQQLVTSFEAHTEGYAEGSQLWTIGGIDWARTGDLIATGGASLGTFFDYKRQRFLGPDDYTVKLWDVRVQR